MSRLTDPEYVATLQSDEGTNSIAARYGFSRHQVTRDRVKIRDGKGPAIQGDVIAGGDFSMSNEDGSTSYGLNGDRAWGYDDWCKFLAAKGQDPDTLVFSHGVTATPHGKYFNKLNNVRPKTAVDGGGPAWPVIQAGPTFVLPKRQVTLVTRKWETAVLMADTQFGYRRYEDGTLDPFHDEKAIEVALKIVELENPNKTVIMGDIIDLAEQGRFAQEASFAGTTQPAIDRTTLFAAQLRDATTGEVDWIEGNHDKRFQNFIETNAKAAFGIRKGNLPDSFPVMSIPALCRLDEYDVTYHDAYPAAHVWINNTLRAEHGTKVNSNGSTAQKYMAETPHISRAFGHTHRLEAQSRTTFDRVGKIRSMGINPGCLCRVDGGVPSVRGAIGANGRPAQVFEDWQQGVAVVYYTENDFFVDLVQIDDGRTVYQGEELRAA